MTDTKLVYAAPQLTVHGSFEEITKGQATGAFTDADFPAHTPVGSLTFSN